MAGKTQQQLDAEFAQAQRLQDLKEQALQSQYDQQAQLAQLKQQQSLQQQVQPQQQKSSGNPLIDAFGSYIQDETQSDMFGSMGRGISQVKLPSTGSWWQDLLIGGLQGLGGGALSQIGSNNVRDNYNEQMAPVLNEKFPGTDFTADLNSDFNPKVQMAQLIGALEDQKQENALRTQLVGNLKLGGRDLQSVGGLGGLLGLGNSRSNAGGGVTLDENGVAIDDATGRPLLKLPGVDDVKKAQEDVGGGFQTSINEKVLKTAREFGDGNVTAAGIEAARRLYQPDIDKVSRSYKFTEEAAKDASRLGSLADQISAASKAAGNTGLGGNLTHIGAGLAGYFSPDQESKFTAGQNLQRFGAESIDLLTKGWKGPLSDRDVQIVMSGQAGNDKTEEFNALYADNLKAFSRMQEDYVDFMEEAADANISVSDADAKWRAIKREIPLTVGGRPNPKWVDGSAMEVVKQSLSGDVPRQESRSVPQVSSGGSTDARRARLEQLRAKYGSK